MVSFKQYVMESTFKKEEIDLFLDPERLSWAKFDAELGYTLNNYLPRDGIDNCYTISTSTSKGIRTPHNYIDKPCRINTYGDSFTQCHQVSDGETWQEYLAAHLGEPIRNYGVGGYGAYQAYRRMVRTEETPNGAENVIFYIWGDDHYRSLLRCRYIACRDWDNDGGRMLHINFWSNMEMDLESGELVEKASLCPTPESLYRMTDPDFMYQSSRDDLMLQMLLFLDEKVEEVDLEKLERLSEILHVQVKKGIALRDWIAVLCDRYAFAASENILDKCRTFTSSRNKRLLVVIFDPYKAMLQAIRSEERYDREIIDYLTSNGFSYFDMNLVHAKDFKCFSLSEKEYYQRYSIGHYSPAGNHFFAFSIKNRIVEMLDPKPISYKDGAEAIIDFHKYLRNY